MPTIQKFNIGFVFFPYGGNGGTSSETPDIRNWLIPTINKIKADPRCGEILTEDFSDTPITMTRNAAAEWALNNGVDFLVMIDSDQSPDVMLGVDWTAKPFWDSTFDFMVAHYPKGPCIVMGAYCGPPTHPLGWGQENVYMFRWVNKNSHQVGRDMALEGYARDHAAMMTGISEVGAGPTGMIMIDTRVFALIPKPYFYYEWEGEGAECPHCRRRERGPESEKISTEDVTFTRNVSLCGIHKLGYNPLFCNWDAWAGHWKPKCVGKPIGLTASNVGFHLTEAVKAGHRENQRIVNLGTTHRPLPETPLTGREQILIDALAVAEAAPANGAAHGD